MKISTIKRETLPHKIITELKHLIESGQLTPGSKLPAERELAQMLGVGRPSLREALKALSILGLIVIKHGEGNFLTDNNTEWPVEPLSIFFSIKKGALIEIYETRKALEMQAASLAAQRRNADNLLEMQAAITRMEENLDNVESFIKHDFEFHIAVGEATNNQVITELIRKMHILGVQTRLAAWKLADKKAFDPKGDLKWHKTLLKHIDNGEPEFAAKCVADHMDIIIERTRMGLSQNTT